MSCSCIIKTHIPSLAPLSLEVWEAWCAAVHGVARIGRDWAAELKRPGARLTAVPCIHPPRVWWPGSWQEQMLPCPGMSSCPGIMWLCGPAYSLLSPHRTGKLRVSALGVTLGPWALEQHCVFPVSRRFPHEKDFLSFHWQPSILELRPCEWSWAGGMGAVGSPSQPHLSPRCWCSQVTSTSGPLSVSQNDVWRPEVAHFLKGPHFESQVL